MRIRILFLDEEGKEIRHFDREVASPKDAVVLAGQIAKDSGIPHAFQKVMGERRCIVALTDEFNKLVDILETAAFDDADAERIGREWSQRSGKKFTTANTRWRR